MAITIKRLSYESSAGIHWPDASVGTEEYYAISYVDLVDVEAELVTSIDWIVPTGITKMDSYINTEYHEGHVKLKPTKAGIFKVIAVINSADTSKTQKTRKEIILKAK